MEARSFHEALVAHGYEYFVGVPDSLLGPWLEWAEQACAVQGSKARYHTASQEGEALALAIGYHLATRKKAVVFLQNSGLGNLINPLMSLAHTEVYDIPLLLVIGWRGAPGFKDEPQHQTMGLATKAILKACEVESQVIRSHEDWLSFLHAGASGAQSKTSAVLIEPGQFKAGGYGPAAGSAALRIDYLQALLKMAPQGVAFVATTGYTSRELWALQKERPSHSCFYSVGGMGYASAIALGYALFQEDAYTCLLDGDGALLMHLGNLASIGQQRPRRLLHILFRNHAHESTGGQPLAASPPSWAVVAMQLGYAHSHSVHSLEEFEKALAESFERAGPVFLEVDIPLGTLAGLPRPSGTPREWKKAFWVPPVWT